ncbi:MAG: ribosome biogenesis GTP-binding protein YihA/YsxC [Bacteroidales bacterium]|nr:ribosome biogenesis GTP-binding protein YihA/YsxC [Bacteroidales bacterium]MDD7724853.1 ribosome biogenesis GTP-binding protein YihA/YsxC [Bacteroidales bacterium]MDY4174698.1 ribosome biogenesis GTP-binding protein YihA/YsxC [Bacteroidales bacterium]
MNITNAKFLVSSAKVTQCPNSKQPEFAFIGRSNVGKSSLINMLCNQKGLAKVSATPGKTQLINHFDINNGEWYLVDLPGYGYAKVPLGEKAKFQSIITDYALKREQLTSFFVLVDVRHPMQTIDRNFMEFLGLHGVPFSIIFTKADKLNEAQVQKSVDAYKAEMLKTWQSLPPMFVTSSAKFKGRDLILGYIGSVISNLEQR